ncbi:aminoglycoside phosphotransferase family protein [Roseibium album]|uniref:aminoglycoside phosphotransferase family protein n=1 Tax=Roseibium album TaxID=311410 RepID=UPI0039190BD7
MKNSASSRPNSHSPMRMAADELALIMVRCELMEEGEPFEISSVEGGVSSNVWYIRTRSGRDMIAKRPLARLNVEQEWLADQRRSNFECMFLRDVRACVPENVASVLAHDVESHTLFIEYFPTQAFFNWREEILAGRTHEEAGAGIGATLAKIHHYFAQNSDARERYDARDILQGTRIDPYFDAITKRHPKLSKKIDKLRSQTLKADSVVIHGDVSPKNILVAPNRQILLDAECACIGDPAFDPSFLLAQLLLKTLVVIEREKEIMAACQGFITSYFDGVIWEDKHSLEQRAIEYLGLFLLARIDGKVPVPYIRDDNIKALAREFGTNLLNLKDKKISDVLGSWSMMINEQYANLESFRISNT